MDYYTRYRLMGCNCSRILERDKHFLTVCMNNYLIVPSLKEAIFLHGLLCDNNTGKLDHLKLYTYQQHGLLLMSYFGYSGSIFLHEYIVSFLYGILEVDKH